MSEEMTKEVTEEVIEAAPVANEPKITCFISKRMVPKSLTEEVQYSAGRKVTVLSEYVRYER